MPADPSIAFWLDQPDSPRMSPRNRAAHPTDIIEFWPTQQTGTKRNGQDQTGTDSNIKEQMGTDRNRQEHT